LGSARLAVTLLSLVALTVLIGAWCPQESQVGLQKVIDEFGEQTAQVLSKWGITDIFHTPWFLILIAMLTVNLIAASFQRVFPKLRLLTKPLPFLPAQAIEKLPNSQKLVLKTSKEKALEQLESTLRKRLYFVKRKDFSLVAEQGKIGRLAPTVTHIGLLSLLVGVTITSWTGFGGFQPVPVDGSLTFGDSEHSKLWIGKLPQWRVKVNETHREDYETGEPKQWYSDLSVIDGSGKEVKRQQISVNNPLTYDGVDIYQSSWALDSIAVSFNGHNQELPLRQMGKVNAAFLPLDSGTILIFSIRGQNAPLRVFAKTPNWPSPKLLAEVPPKHSINLGSVQLTYKKAIPVTGLQYKCDPALPLTYVAFGFIMAGVLLAAIPYRQLWASSASSEETDATAEPNTCILTFGGTSMKAKAAFTKSLEKIAQEFEPSYAHYQQTPKEDQSLCPTSN
jgi:cytochrome c biogenesis protein